MELFERMKTLCALDGISGREQDVSAEILRQLEGVADEARWEMSSPSKKAGKPPPTG